MALRYYCNNALQKAAVDKDTPRRGEMLLMAAYRQMLAWSKTRPDDRSLPSDKKDPKPFLVSLIDLLRDLEKDKMTDFAKLRLNSSADGHKDPQ